MGPTEPLRLAGVGIGALNGIDLKVSPGEIVCLSGASGSGKSRLLRAVADLEPHAGEVWLGGQAQSQTLGHAWRRRVMLVPAESHWWAETVAEHFVKLPGAAELQTLGLAEDALTWQVGRLSTGEKQRLALLRAVSREPRALLVDEPTANLDAETGARVEAWLAARIHERGWPTLWVAHDRGQIARVGRRHWRIAGGRLEEVEVAWT
ncbi:ATP-binding cassette domain-containing protein [Halomonas sp. MCCC 1A17488]|uniref:ATP-binding cassette domain-containing protein n=1 Tax=Billgrantia sulfidoxydans TaxID=2733484 RepID=A0ABX7W4B9_9GAMM|nr:MULTISPECIES: ATP-binding cassette domain-containing protein [Halomonas]MCE8015702.1 ATP-binding cassette domain-containing protein [Halomonas sp. MCCC 1A17488]MCG3239035.1 ATP-binding cassette domain-containing protein [Halomonas sp. MCCC 1A17488]QPP51015.1 ATP-binding cassette domain-containing protein [Halomonas sp. SS10-MC5]QTP54527.1 ATP-binding cassette domain-containing protein [Halomonas sulfidoxydans]